MRFTRYERFLNMNMILATVGCTKLPMKGMRTWVGEDYDLERFNVVDIEFHNPNIRLRQLYR